MTEGLSETQRARLIEHMAQAIMTRRLAEPAILFLSATFPLGTLGSHLLYGIEPVLSILVERQSLRQYALLLEDRAALQQLLERIEILSARGNAP